METEGPWCANASCPDCGKIGAHNITMHSYAARRLRCTTCHRTVSAAKGTFFETLRPPRPRLLAVVAMLVERNSLRAVSRIKPCTADAVLHCVDLAGQQGAASNRPCIRDLHPTQVQVDALWSCVKKNKRLCHRGTLPTGGTPGGGVPSPSRVISGSCPICRTRAARRRRRLFWRPAKHARMGTRLWSPVISCRPAVAALIAPDRTPAPPPAQRGRGRPRPRPRRVLEAGLLYAQVDKRRAQGRVAEVRRRSICGACDISTEVLGGQQINTADVERDNRTSRQSIGRLVRQTLSHATQSDCLRRHRALEDAVCKFVRPHQALRVAVSPPTPGRKWQQRTPAMAAELTDHIWSLEELLSYRVPPPKD
jgi:hypothetical protein